jgi:glycosyltransferase involved in cell wall biosynthesis
MWQPLVSVIIPAYNGQQYIRQAIESALAQTYPAVEVLVIDDGSPMPMQEAASGFGPNVRYLRKENGGTASARNFGLKAAKGELIALLDQDDLWLPMKLEKQVPRFVEDPRIGLVTAWMEVFDSETGEVKGTFKPAAEMTMHDMLGHELPPVQTMVIRRTALEKIGGFDESMKGTDDWDLNIRLAIENRVVAVEEVLGRARMHDAQQGSNGEKMYLNSVRVLEKNKALHGDCEECRRALEKSWKLIRQYHAMYIKDRAKAAWKEGKYTAAIGKAARAMMEDPAVMAGVFGKAFKSKD